MAKAQGQSSHALRWQREKPISSTPQCRPISGSCISPELRLQGSSYIVSMPTSRKQKGRELLKVRSLWVGLQGSSVRGEWKTGGMSTFYPVSPLGSPENYRFWFQANGHKAEQRRLQLLKNNSQKIKKYTYDTAVYTVYISLLTYKTMRLNGRFYLTKISIIACVNGISRYLLLEHTWNCLFLLGICLGYLHDYHASLPTFPVEEKNKS